MKYETKACLRCGTKFDNITARYFERQKFCNTNCGKLYRYRHNNYYKKKDKVDSDIKIEEVRMNGFTE
jgi:hydrogenase maturation factor HypF (carbamoyltransferase family)